MRLRVDPDSVAEPDGTTDVVTDLGDLVDNAVDATASGGHVAVSLGRHDDDTTITVSDDGPGVPPEDRDRIFGNGVSSKQAGPGGARGDRPGPGVARGAASRRLRHRR